MIKRKQSNNLLTSIRIGFTLIWILIFLAFIGWIGSSFNFQLNQLHNSLRTSWDSVYAIVEPEVLGRNDDNRYGYRPLVPIHLKRLPSPFMSSRINHYKNTYQHKKHVFRNNVSDNKLELLLGYSAVELSSGKLGSNYLSAIIWFDDYDLVLDKASSSAGRDSGDHFWFSYHDADNNLGFFLLSLQEVGRFSKVQSNGRVAEVAGYIAQNIGTTRGLKRESTISGSLFKDNEKNKYVLVFRVMVPNTSSKKRKSIDVAKPVGIRYVNRKTVDGKPEELSTFKNINGKIISVIHHPVRKIIEELAGIDKNISSFSLIKDKKIRSEYRVLLREEFDISKHHSGILIPLIQNYLFKLTKLIYKNKINRAERELYYDGPIDNYLFSEAGTKLRVSASIDKAISLFIDDIKQSIYLLIFVTMMIVATYLFVSRHVVLRIMNLTKSLGKYELDQNGQFSDKSMKSSDEVGVLAKTLEKLLFKVHAKSEILSIQASELAVRAEQAEEGYRLREVMMKIFGHDIRTPVAALLSLLEKNDEAIKYVKQIYRASEAIIETSGFEDSLTTKIKIAPLDLVCFGKAITNGLGSINTVDIQFKTNEELLIVNADEEYLEDAVDCIINNACDYGDYVEVSVKKDLTHGSIEVFNNGENINEEVVESIFEYGTSYRSGTNDSHHGVGLFSSKLRIGAMGGSVEAFNREGGVSFVIKLPLSKTAIKGDQLKGTEGMALP